MIASATGIESESATRKERMQLCLQLRDQHLAQLMATSGAATLAVLAAAVGALYSAEKIKSLNLGSCVSWVVAGLFVTAVVTLVCAGHRFACFHMAAIRELERKAANGLEPVGGDFQIVPSERPWRRNPMFVTFLGITMLVAAAGLVVVVALVRGGS
jgi:hypothetical protein